MDSDHNTLSYWYFNEDQSDNAGHYVGQYNDEPGVWNYDENTTLSGTFKADDGSFEGTWWAEASDPYTFIVNLPEEEETDMYVATNEGDACGWVYDLGYFVDCLSLVSSFVE